MRLSLQTDYALRTLMFLAGRPGRRQIAQVAEYFSVSVNHVAKAVNRLARLGFIRAVRGIGGGIELARRPEDLRLGELIVALEGNLHLLDCVAAPNVCVIQPGCRLRAVLAESERRQVEFLNQTRLSDLVPAGALPTELAPLAAPRTETGPARRRARPV